MPLILEKPPTTLILRSKTALGPTNKKRKKGEKLCHDVKLAVTMQIFVVREKPCSKVLFGKAGLAHGSEEEKRTKVVKQVEQVE